MELLDLGGRVIKVARQQIGQRVPLGQIGVKDALLVLVQNRAAGVLKDCVA